MESAKYNKLQPKLAQSSHYCTIRSCGLAWPAFIARPARLFRIIIIPAPT